MQCQLKMAVLSKTDLKSLKCVLCKHYLSCGPVFIRKQRQSVCGRCNVVKERGIRNHCYEISATRLRFPCSYKRHGCKETQTFAPIYSLSHEFSCEFRTYKCIFAEDDQEKCQWKSFKTKLIGHCKTTHPGKLLNNCCTLEPNVKTPNTNNYLFVAFQMAFVLHVRVIPSKFNSKIIFQLAFLGKQEAAAQFHYTVDILKDHSLVNKRSQMINYMEIELDSLEDLFNGFDGVTFHITITVFCEKCKKELMSGKLYNKGPFWYCLNCSPILQRCKNKGDGCGHQDNPIKISKHEQYFCNKYSQNLLFGAEFLDYGKIWLIKTSYVKSVLTTDIGLVVCEFISLRTEGKFEILMYSSVKSNQEGDFSCKVYVGNPFSGETLIFNPEFETAKEYDWYIEIEQLKHPSWGSELAIYVVIQRNQFVRANEEIHD